MKEPKLYSGPETAETPGVPSAPLPAPAPTPKAQGAFKSALEQTTLDRQLALIRELLARGGGGS